MYIWLFEAGQDRAEAVGAAENKTDELLVDDVLGAVDETLLPGDSPDTLTAEMVLLPEAG